MRSKPSVALVVIARDEARCIERCLMSAKPFVDRMVVLDTGSVDQTVDIARQCGADVAQGTWENDFSKARNQALDFADADEWITRGGEFLRSEMDRHVLGRVLVRNLFEASGKPQVSQSWITRLLPAPVRFEGPIHEQACSGLRRIQTPLLVEHDGYLPEQRHRKSGRNRSLLEQALARSPQDAYLLYVLGKDHEISGDMNRAVECYQSARTFLTGQEGYTHDLVNRLIYTLSQSGRLEEALSLASAEIGHWNHSPDFHFILGNLFLDCAVNDPDKARSEWLPLAKEAWEQCLIIGERPDLEGSVEGRGSFLASHNLKIISTTPIGS